MIQKLDTVVLPTSARRSTDKVLPKASEQQQYSRIGRNADLEAKPAIVHFGGYEPLKEHRQMVRVVNASAKSTRLTILPPKTGFFRLNCTKRGLVAPGMAEEIEVVFTPKEWRYYYDCIRVQCEHENMLIPLHGYPVMNDAIFPKSIDLGTCNVGQTITQGVKLECKVPIEFEYSISTIGGQNPEFSVSPASGIVPANGGVEVEITYSPQRMTTAELQLHVTISQFGFKPILCRVVASAEPGAPMASKAEIEGMAKTIVKQQRPKSASSSSRKKKRRSKKKRKSAKAKKAKAKAAQRIDGIRVPEHLDSHAAVNFMMTQQAGKLKLDELKEAIAVNQLESDKQQAELEANMSPTAAGRRQVAHEGDHSFKPDSEPAFAGNNRQMKEMIFVRSTNDYSKHEQSLVINPTKQRTGQKAMDDEARGKLEAQRNGIHAKIAWGVRETERNRSNEGLRTTTRPVVRENEHIADDLVLSDVTFDYFNNDDWRKRQRTLDQFIRSISKLVVRQRCDKRIAAVRAVLMQNNAAKEDKEPLTDCGLSDERVGRANWLAVQSDTPPDRQPVALEALEFPSFVLTRPLSLQMPYEYQLLQYQEHQTEMVPAVVRREKHPFYRVGALEEQATRGPMGDEADFTGANDTKSNTDPEEKTQEKTKKKTITKSTTKSTTIATIELVPPLEQTHTKTPSIPDELLRPPPTRALQALRSEPRLAVYSKLHAAAETTPHYHFLPTELKTTSVPFWLAEKAGSECMHALRDLPTTADVVAERTEPVIDFACAKGDDFPDLNLLGPSPAMLSGLPVDDLKNLEDDPMDEAEGLGFSGVVPTLAAARALFSQDESSGAASPPDSGKRSPRSAKSPRKNSARGKGADPPSDAASSYARLPMSHYDKAGACQSLTMQEQAKRKQLVRRLTDGYFEMSSRENDWCYVPPLVWPYEAPQN